MRYLIVGVVNNLALYLVMLALLAAGLVAWQATLLVYPTGVAVSYVLNKIWSFSRRRRRRGQFLAYLAVYGSAYPLAIGSAWAVEHMGAGGALAALAGIVVPTAFIFLGLSFWVFRHEEAEQPSEDLTPTRQ